MKKGKMLSVLEAALKFGISPESLYRYIRLRRLPFEPGVPKKVKHEDVANLLGRCGARGAGSSPVCAKGKR